MYELTPWGNGINFEEISICYKFNITFVIIIYDFDVKLAHYFVKKRIFCIKHNIWPPGVSIYGLTPWGNGIYFEQLSICINFNMTFVINIQYLRSKWYIFCQKMYILHKTSHLTPWGAYVWTYPLGQWYLFWIILNMLQF